MLEIIRLIIDAVWKLLSIPITVDNYSFNTWQFMLFIITIAVMLNLLFKKKEGK